MDTDKKLLAYLNIRSAIQSRAIPGKNGFTFISKMRELPQVWILDKANNSVHFVDRVMSVNHLSKGNRRKLV